MLLRYVTSDVTVGVRFTHLLVFSSFPEERDLTLGWCNALSLRDAL
jgi:hypothetical protein